MGAEKLKSQVPGDTANWRSIKNEEKKTSMEPACGTENMIHFTCMYILHACLYFLCIHTHTHTHEYLCLCPHIKCVYIYTQMHTHAHT